MVLYTPIAVYEGGKSGVGRQTKSDSWQNNRPTRDNVKEVEIYFDDVALKNGVIIAKSSKAIFFDEIYFSHFVRASFLLNFAGKRKQN
jgi:hypothetical protein